MSAPGGILFVAKWLETNPKYSDYNVGILLFVSLDSLMIDGADVGQRGPVQFAAWWLWGAAPPPLDRVVLGYAGLQLASWYPDTGISRSKVAPDPTLEFAKVEVVNSKPGEWRVRLKMKGGEIKGECVELSDRKEMNYPMPEYTTILLGGPNPSKYIIFTYYGHHMRNMRAEWNFKGDHV